MQLHQLKPKTKSKKIKRVGRGGKRGTYSGRGQKGQKARAGRKLFPHRREIVARFPKKRGFKNKPKKPKPAVVTLDQLNKIKEIVINLDVLKKYNLIPKKEKLAKILNKGKITSAKEIVGISCSRAAREAILKAGGKVS
ncbi:MAG: 50S ribosomal protein L15 [Candidatus Parcubacteria bacterium]|nr:MAG: 50S ribosomal protein L15 [Candidatus Parcubacteria bacterium]